MKNIMLSFLCLTAAIVISSCVNSLYPISENENDFIFREELLGNWADKGMQTQVIIKKATEKIYGVTIIDKLKNPGGKHIPVLDTSYYLGFMIELNGQQYVDCSVDISHPKYVSIAKDAGSALAPLHFIYKLSIIGNDKISITGINYDSLKKFIASYPNTVKYKDLKEGPLMLTAEAAGLQKNILTNEKAAFVFSEKNIVTRIK
ncbi:MAG: hypothetical protein ABIY51_08440 [Ferruginibacter sp.]